MKPRQTFPALVFLATLGAPLFAQPAPSSSTGSPAVPVTVNGAVIGSANAHGNLTPPVRPQLPSLAQDPSVATVNGTVNGVTSAVALGPNGTPLPGVAVATNATTNAGVNDSLAARQQERLRAEGVINAKAAAVVEAHPPVGVTGNTSATVVLDAAPTAQKLRTASFETRDQVWQEVDRRIEASADAMARANAAAVGLDAEARAKFQIACDNARAREKVLQDSLKTARVADASRWTDARMRVAADFEAYAGAVAQAEANSRVTKR